MKRGIAFLGLVLCLFVMNSCVGVGAVVTIAAFGVEAYEEARIHRPDLKLAPISDHLRWPNIEFFSEQSSDQNNTKTDQNGTKTATSSTSSKFGFDCSKMEGKKNQSKCFHDFSKALAREENKYNKQKDIVAVREKKTSAKTQKVAKALKRLSSKVVKNSSQGNTTKTKKSAIAEGIPASHIENWARAWEKQDVASYIAFYSKEFKGFKNHRGAWEASRQNALKKNKNISIKLSNIQIHQKGKEKIEVNFIQKYQSDGYADTGIKELLLEKRKAGWKIVKETWMPTTAPIKNKHSASRTEQINAKLASWLKAWEDQDVNAYLSFYSDKFKAPKGSRTKSKWRNSRYRALKANKNISIQVSNLQISSSKKTIELNFIQEFNSDKYSSVGIKELVWEKTGSDWKILKETWISS